MFRSSLVLLVVLCLLLGADYLSAWTAPTAIPPAANVTSPLNTSAVAQSKTGALGVGPLSVFGRMYVQGSAALPAPNTSVALEVEGSVAANAYCGGDGGNCTNAADLGGAGVG